MSIATTEPTPTLAEAAPVQQGGVSATLGGCIHRLSLAQYQAMIDAGILTSEDRIELLEGLLVTKMSKNPPHTLASKLLQAALMRVLMAGWHIAKEEPVLLPPASEPEPDLTVVRGNPHDYAHRKPTPADVPLVVEISDSSLAFDRGFKLRLYARAGLPVYWIVNLIDGVVEVHRDPIADSPEPSYRSRETIGRDGHVTLDLAGAEPIRLAVRDILP